MHAQYCFCCCFSLCATVAVVQQGSGVIAGACALVRCARAAGRARWNASASRYA